MNKATPSITLDARYQSRIQELESCWNLEDAARTRWVYNTSTGNLPLLDEALSWPSFFQDKVLQLDEQLKVLDWVEGLDIDDLYVPHLQPHAGVTIFASAFGCPIEFPKGMYPRSLLALKEQDNPENVYQLKRPSIDDGQLGEMLDWTDTFVAQTGGRYPIQMTDIQSPIDTALLIWDPNALMLAMFDHPREVHHLMQMITDLTIEFIKEHSARAPEFIPMHFPAVWYPDGMGIAISDDALAVLSPATYKEFALPYTNQLSEAFNGIFIHSCGDFTHQFENLESVHKLRGINFGTTETPFEAVWERFNGVTAIAPHMGLNKDIVIDSQLEYIQHILSVKTHNRGLLITVSPEKVCDSILDAKKLEAFAQQVNRLLDEDARRF